MSLRTRLRVWVPAGVVAAALLLLLRPSLAVSVARWAYAKVAGRRSHSDVMTSVGDTWRPGLQAAVASTGDSYPPQALTLVFLKSDRRLEVWAPSSHGWRLVRLYPVFAASGRDGPKLRSGDGQVPEGIYAIDAFNPNSHFHLSLRVAYPNAADRAAAAGEGREDLGGDIFIHGGDASIGCIALGDAAIEELYVLVGDVGLSKTRVLLAPSAEPTAAPYAPGWVGDLYRQLAAELHVVRAALERS